MIWLSSREWGVGKVVAIRTHPKPQISLAFPLQIADQALPVSKPCAAVRPMDDRLWLGATGRGEGPSGTAMVRGRERLGRIRELAVFSGDESRRGGGLSRRIWGIGHGGRLAGRQHWCWAFRSGHRRHERYRISL